MQHKNPIHRSLILIILFVQLLLLSGFSSFSQLELPVNTKPEAIRSFVKKQSFIYAIKDSLQLGLDLYTNDSIQTNTKKPCVIFVFGGGFVMGRRDAHIYNTYFNSLVAHNYDVVSISYRLGLKGATKVSAFNIKPLRNAIQMAVDDLFDATDWVVAHADSLNIDTSTIIISGSSAGAIAVLQADFERANGNPAAKKLPSHFRYAAVLAYSGAILSYDGRFRYVSPPAPTMMFYGTADKIVPYNKIRIFNRGMYGSSWIARTCKKQHYPYYIYRAEGLGHEMSVLPMINQLPRVYDFLDQYVLQHKQLQIDISYHDPSIKPLMTMTPAELYKKLGGKK
ncbi:MAG TPA: alpha/beta hydrolase [Ferruginibacter sp.]|nr:alpha/beta hydrolase [Ferruginibacter sp.]